MHILLTAATRLEIKPVQDWLQQQNFRVGHHTVEILITGVGSMSTTYQLMAAIHRRRPDYLLQAGIGGSFHSSCPPGSLVLVAEEVMGDTGVEEQNHFRDLFDMGFQLENTLPFSGKGLVNLHQAGWHSFGLPFVKSVSISEITTRTARIEQLQQKYGAFVESMEGAAFHYVCLLQRLPFMQLRAISNEVGERDKTKWKMQEAIGLLNEQLKTVLQDPVFVKYNNFY